MFPLNAVIRVSRRAAQRRLIGAMLRNGSIGWALGGALGLALIVLQKAFGSLVTSSQTPVVWVAMGAGLVGFLVGAGVAVARRLTLFQAADLVDQTLGLRSRLATGLALVRSAGVNDPAFVELSLRDSEATAAGVDARAAVPIALSRCMAIGPALTVLAGLIALFAPSIDWAAEVRESGSPAAAEVSPLVEEVRSAAETIHELSRSPEVESATREQAELIDRLERELLEGRKNPDEARAAAASSLHEAAEALEEAARDRQRAADELRERLASRSNIEPEPFAVEEIRELAERLGEGDLERAASAADALADRFASMTDEERARTSEELRRLAEQLEPPPPDEPAGPTTPEEAEAPESKPESTPEASPPERDLRELAESLRRAAEEPPPPSHQPPEPRTGRQPPEGSTEPRESPKGPEETPPSGEPTPQPEVHPEPGEQPRQQPAPEQQHRDPQPGGQQQPQPGESPEPQQPPQPQPGTQPQQQEQPTGEPRPQPSGEGTPKEQPTAQPGAEERSPEPVPQPGEQPDQGGKPGEPSESPGEEGGSQGSGMERLTERLREMARREQDAREMKQGADELRERAERLLEGMDEGQRRALERWAAQLEREAPPEWTGPTETIDATGDATPGERVAGEWYGRGSDSPSPEEVAQRIMRARRGVERSIEQQTVPRRHADFLRRVFERYAERAQRP